MASTRIENRPVTLLFRYTEKNTAARIHPVGTVLLLVRNGEGREYCVTLRRNKIHSCTCDGNAKYKQQCYHIAEMRKQENERWQQCRESGKCVTCPTACTVEAPCVEEKEVVVVVEQVEEVVPVEVPVVSVEAPTVKSAPQICKVPTTVPTVKRKYVCTSLYTNASFDDKVFGSLAGSSVGRLDRYK